MSHVHLLGLEGMLRILSREMVGRAQGSGTPWSMLMYLTHSPALRCLTH